MVADGYKKTNVGVIPEDWELKNFKEVFTFLTTATYSRADLTEDGSIQYLHYGDIHTKYDFTLDFTKYELPHISTEQLRKYPLLKDGDIVMADASEDYNGICKSIEIQNLTSKKAIAGLHTFLLRDKNNIFINGFKGYLASSYLLKAQFDRLATGMKVFGVSKGNLLKVQVPIPPKQEQQAIATALSDTDELINSLERLIAKKEAIKTGTMQELLTGKKRLDGFSGEWEEKEIKDLKFDISDGNYSSKYPSTQDFKTTGIAFIRANNVKDMTVSDFDMRYISCKKHEELQKGHLKKNDILITTRGEIGQVSLVPNRHINSNINAQVVRINTGNKVINNRFLAYFLILKKTQEKILSMQTGSALKQLPVSRLVTLKIIYPRINEQEAIATILSDMNNDIKALKAKLSKVKAIKEGMMQELLTGKTRLLKDME